MTRVNTLTEIWDTYNNNVLNEAAPAAKAAKFGTKPGPGPKNMNDKTAGHLANDDTSGPGNAEGVMKEPYTVDDPQKTEVNNKKTKSEIKVGKKVKESINNYMKSTFDKLFENVMSDEEQGELEALGVDTEETDESSEGDEITVTLDKDMAKALCDILKDAMGEEAEDMEHEDMEHEDYEEMEEVSEYEEDAEDHEDGEDHDKEDEEDEEVAKEAVDAEDHGHALVNLKDSGLTSTKNNKVALKTSKKKADAKIKKQDDGGSELGDAGGHSLTSTKNNKVGSLKVNADLFGD